MNWELWSLKHGNSELYCVQSSFSSSWSMRITRQLVKKGEIHELCLVWGSLHQYQSCSHCSPHQYIFSAADTQPLRSVTLHFVVSTNHEDRHLQQNWNYLCLLLFVKYNIFSLCLQWYHCYFIDGWWPAKMFWSNIWNEVKCW